MAAKKYTEVRPELEDTVDGIAEDLGGIDDDLKKLREHLCRYEWVEARKFAESMVSLLEDVIDNLEKATEAEAAANARTL